MDARPALRGGPSPLPALPHPTSRLAGERILFSVEEAGAALGVGRSRMYQLIAAGEIQTVRIGRLRRIRPEDLRAYVSELARR